MAYYNSKLASKITDLYLFFTFLNGDEVSVQCEFERNCVKIKFNGRLKLIRPHLYAVGTIVFANL